MIGGLCHVEEAVMAVAVLVLAFFPRLLNGLIVAADAHAIVDHLEFSRAASIAMGHEHRL